LVCRPMGGIVRRRPERAALQAPGGLVRHGSGKKKKEGEGREKEKGRRTVIA